MFDALQPFLPPIRRWFTQRLGLPTPPQTQGWPSIAAGQSCLILAPTGSGKTLAAFLTAIDRLARDLLDNDEPDGRGGVQILYLSPLKALANDVEKNLLTPLAEIADLAHAMHHLWPDIRIAVRTGDTPQKQRASMLRHPPHLLITTPESLHLILTSAARRILSSTRYVIVDEAHSLAGTKRGVFLSILVERLEHERHYAHPATLKIAPGVTLPQPPVPALIRIGLSATARPADQIARWLAGYDDTGAPRPITIVDTGQRKMLDLAVQCPWSDSDGLCLNPQFSSGYFRENPPRNVGLRQSHSDELWQGEPSNWPPIVRLLLQLIRVHRSTLVFANSRRLVERLMGMLEDTAAATGQPLPPIRPHHGSISKATRLATEQALKAGDLSAVVATSSLELGIDIGALDLVCQVDSPGTVAAALQRVGRAGHLEKATAKGRMVPKSETDLAQFAALVPLMLAGTVEETHVPQNCLDVLAQQIVAACATQSWPRHDLYALFRRSANYHGLPEAQFDSVVSMLAAKFADAPVSLRPRISFDRVNDQLLSLPTSAHLALVNGGVISDTGQFPVYIAARNVRIGELDEEFVFESKVGDQIVLGSQTWQIETIDPDRVQVVPAPPGRGRMPFWRADVPPRSALLGEALGQLCRQIEEQLAADPAACRRWLLTTHHLDDPAVDELLALFARQTNFGSAMPTDRRIVVEHFRDRTGELVVAILSPFGGRIHHPLRLALEARFADRRIPAQFTHSDDGILIRPSGPAGDAPLPENPLTLLTAELLGPLIVDQLEESALFGLCFRQNAVRALMLPKVNPQRRTPLWQQRLRAKNLLAIVKQQRNFPIVVETYRECLQDLLLIDRARRLLAEIESGQVQVEVHDTMTPSPMARLLWMNFERTFLYQWDEPLVASQVGPTVDSGVLDAVLQRTLEPAASAQPWSDGDLATFQRRLSGSDYPARTTEELLEKIAAAGAVDLGDADDPGWREWSTDDPGPMLQTLQQSTRLVRVGLPDGGKRWLATESLGLWLCALGHRPPLSILQEGGEVPIDYAAIPAALLACDYTESQARRLLVEVQLRRVAVTTLPKLQSALPFMRDDIPAILQSLRDEGIIAATRRGDEEVALRDHLDQLRDLALRRQRRAIAATAPAALQCHLLEWHHILHPRDGLDALEDALDTLTPLVLPLSVWEYDLLPLRISGFAPRLLDDLLVRGHWVWVGYPDQTVAFIPRHLLAQRPVPPTAELSPAAAKVSAYLAQHGASYATEIQIDLLESEEGLRLALRELVFVGMVSNDRLDSLRAVLAAPDIQVSHGSEKVLVDPGRYPASLLRSGSERSRDSRGSRLARLKVGRWRNPEHLDIGGRWFMLPAVAPPTDPLQLAERAAERAERLLRRHGFASRELCDLRTDGSWRECYDVLTRMEWAGHVRRGYFVEGLGGSQFTLPGINLSTPSTAPSAVCWLAMLDPANLWAQITARWTDPAGNPVRIPQVPGSWLALVRGVPVLAAISWGATLIPLTPDAELLNMALRRVSDLLPHLPPDQRHFLHIRHWIDPGGSILGSPAEEPLRQGGFARDTQGLRLYRDYASAAEVPRDQGA